MQPSSDNVACDEGANSNRRAPPKKHSAAPPVAGSLIRGGGKPSNLIGKRRRDDHSSDARLAFMTSALLRESSGGTKIDFPHCDTGSGSCRLFSSYPNATGRASFADGNYQLGGFTRNSWCHHQIAANSLKFQTRQRGSLTSGLLARRCMCVVCYAEHVGVSLPETHGNTWCGAILPQGIYLEVVPKKGGLCIQRR